MIKPFTQEQEDQHLRFEVFKHMSNKYDANDTSRMLEDIEEVVEFLSVKKKTNPPGAE